MAATGQGDRRGQDPVGGTPFDLGAAQIGKPKTRVPEILLGTFLVALFALAGAWFYSTSTESDRYVALGTAVQRGQEIDGSELVFIDISTNANILSAVRDTELDAIIGKLAVTDLEAGTLITPAQFTERSVIPQGDGVVGVVVDPGEYPSFEIRPGDWVRVIETGESFDGQEVQSARLINGNVEIVGISPLDGNELFVSMITDVATADEIATVGQRDNVGLILVPQAGPGGDDDVARPAETSTENTEEAPADGTADADEEAQDG